MIVTRPTFNLIERDGKDSLSAQAIVSILQEHGVPCSWQGDLVTADSMIAYSHEVTHFNAGISVSHLAKWLGY